MMTDPSDDEESAKIDREIATAPPCPGCMSRSLALWVYGESGPSVVERARVRSDVVIGGGALLEDSPKWQCRDCGVDFGFSEDE